MTLTLCCVGSALCPPDGADDIRGEPNAPYTRSAFRQQVWRRGHHGDGEEGVPLHQHCRRWPLSHRGSFLLSASIAFRLMASQV